MKLWHPRFIDTGRTPLAPTWARPADILRFQSGAVDCWHWRGLLPVSIWGALRFSASTRTRGSGSLNLGRNMIYPTEAFYHALFLASIVCILRNRLALALALAFLLSVSHPFTGLELLAILLAWSFVESYFMERTNPG
jgi:hypothetical protein